MFELKVNRRRGLLAMVGSLLWVVGAVFSGAGGTRSEAVMRTVFLNPALWLFIVGLMGFHARQARRSGWVGTAGFGICLLGTGIMLLGNITEIWVYWYLQGVLEARWAPGWLAMGCGLMLLPVGFVVLGIGTLRAKTFTGWRRAVPTWFGVMLAMIVGGLMLSYFSETRDGFAGVISRVAPALTTFGFPLGWAALGYSVWSEQGSDGG